MRVLSVCLLLAEAATIIGASDKPDFSGRWVLVAAQPADAEVARVLTVSQSVRRTNLRGESMTAYYDRIAIQRESAGGTTWETHHLGAWGGSVPGIGGDPKIKPATHIRGRCLA